jgi:hypothetical protein
MMVGLRDVNLVEKLVVLSEKNWVDKLDFHAVV